MTCKELILDLMADYLERLLEPHLAADIQRHLDTCEACRAYVATYRRTRVVVGESEAAPMPAELAERLRASIFGLPTRSTKGD